MKYNNKGFTLIETLIVSFLIVIILGIVYSIFSQSLSSSEEQSIMLKLQEKARITLNTITTDLRGAQKPYGASCEVVTINPNILYFVRPSSTTPTTGFNMKNADGSSFNVVKYEAKNTGRECVLTRAVYRLPSSNTIDLNSSLRIFEDVIISTTKTNSADNIGLEVTRGTGFCFDVKITCKKEFKGKVKEFSLKTVVNIRGGS